MGRRRKNPFIVLAILAIAVFAIAVSQGYIGIPSGFEKTSVSKIPPGCGELKVTILNVSQADAILIQSPKNKTILVDMASKMKPNSSDRLLSFLEENGISKIDILIATHYHEDHIGGAEKLFRAVDVGTVYSNGNCGNSGTKSSAVFEAYAATGDFRAVSQDASLQVDDCISAKLIVAYDRAQGCFSNENDNSILLKLDYGATSFLFTGDCEKGCEQELIRQGTDLSCDVLKIGHHGSSTSSSSEFLEKAGAGYFVISVDRDRSAKDGYFHPKKAALEGIYAVSKGTNTFRTDANGNIQIISDGAGIQANPEIPASQCDIFRGYNSADASGYSVISQLDSICRK